VWTIYNVKSFDIEYGKKMTIGVKFELKNINIIKEETLGINVRCKN
jgi:hypothetical protein